MYFEKFRHILARALAKLYEEEEDVEEAPSNCNRLERKRKKNLNQNIFSSTIFTKFRPCRDGSFLLMTNFCLTLNWDCKRNFK